ncbi:MAG: sugar-binding protein [Bacteroidales bacterium]
MTRNLQALLMTGVILLFAAPVQIISQSIFYIPETSASPVIDGEEEALWNDADFWSIDQIYGGTILDEKDFSGDWKATWDPSNLYLLFKVQDASLHNLGPGADKFWIHDCVELFIDLLNDKDLAGTGDTPDDDNYQYRFIWNLDDEPIFEAPPSGGLLNASKTLVDGADTIGYHIEVSIPWATLTGTHPFGAVEIGKQVGTEVKIADLDTPTVSTGVWSPDAELLWNNSTGTDLKISALFGTIQLVHFLMGDFTPPAPVTDLGGEATGSRSVSLSWTAPADDNTGRVAAYELALGTDSAGVAQWSSAETGRIPGTARMPGETEDCIIDTLTTGTTYYFGVRSNDGLGNASEVSNILKLKTYDPDLVAPGPVTDLAIDSSSSFMADLSWTSPGDDGSMGTAASYDIRQYHETLTLENWELASLVEGAPIPLEAGEKQSFRIHGLQPGNTYFFGIRSMDESPNISGLSNIVKLETPAFTYKVKHPVDQMIGTNSFIDVPMENMEAVGYIREYHPWSFTEIEDDTYEYNRWNGYWDFDAYYTDLHNRGIMVCPALWASPEWLEPNSTNKPCGEDEDPQDPSSYTEMAQLMYQYAARYGKTTVEESKLLVNAGQVKKSGLGILSYFEDWNEQDRDWEGRDAQFTAEEYAAMASANADGHAGSLGEGLGLKTADPSAKFVMGGLYILGTVYITGMYNWFIENRPDHRWPVDVINMHHYAYSFTRNGICPEEDGYKAMVQEVIGWRNEYAPENEVWLTEFGYDTNDESPNRINPFGGFTQQEIQAQWIVRTYLILSSVGVDRAAQFMIRDVDPNPEPRWSDCGLTLSPSEGNVPKTSWYYVYSLKNILRGNYFDKVISESASAHVYRFINEEGNQYTYALWSPTGDGSTSQYRLKIPAGPSFLRKIELKDGSTTGVMESMDPSSDMISLDISETPLFLVANYGEPDGLRNDKSPSGGIIFPNPFKGVVEILIPGGMENSDVQISIYGVEGREVMNREMHCSGQILSLDLGGLENGIYILVAQTGNRTITEKIVKQ